MYSLALFSYLNKIGTWGAKIIWALIIILVGYATIKIVFKIIEHLFLAKQMPERPYGTPKETKTLVTLTKSIIKYVTGFLILVFVLKVFNVNLTPLLMGAGVVGFAIGFGAQSFIKDFLSGLTLLFEKNLSVGDYVEIAGSAGVIEEIGVRTTKIRDISGQTHILFNGNITLIKNFTTGAVRVVLDVFLEKEKDITRGKIILQDLLEDYSKNLGLSKNEIAISSLDMKSPQTVIRAEFAIIPLFQNLLSQQVIPRLKEVFAEQNISLSSNRIDATFLAKYPQRKTSS